MTVLVFAYLGSLLVRADGGFTLFWDLLVAGTAFALCAASVWARASWSHEDRAVFVAIAAGMTSYTIGNVARAWHAWSDQAPNEASIADIGYLGFPVGIAVALVLELRHTPMAGHTPEVLLDGLMGALGASAGMAVIVEPILAAAPNGSQPLTPEAIVSIAYPVCDILLISVIFGTLSLPRRSGGPHWLWVGLGLGFFVLADVIYALRVLNGDSAGVQFLDGLWLLGFYVIAWGVWLHYRATSDSDGVRRWTLAAPLASLVIAVTVLVVGSFGTVSLLAVALATGTLAAVVLRTALSFRSMRRLAAAEQLARTDELTGLRNRRAMTEALEVLSQGLPRDSSLMVISIDLDEMKSINDTLGHAAGDEALRRIADAIRNSVRPGDFAGRMGGDEFVVASIHTHDPHLDDSAAGQSMAERISANVAASPGIPIRVSVGAALGPVAGESLAELMHRADQRMYEDKRQHQARPNGSDQR